MSTCLAGLSSLLSGFPVGPSQTSEVCSHKSGTGPNTLLISTPLSTLRPGSSQFTTSRRQGHDPRRGLASKGFKSTVSRYLPDRITDRTCDAIAQAIRELDYRPNTAVRNLTRNHSRSSGCSATTSGGHGTESS